MLTVLSSTLSDLTDIIIVSVPKASFKEFIVNDMTSIIHLMQQQSKKVFIPVAVAQSIVMPDQEVQIAFRNSKNVKNLPLAGWFTQNVPMMCKKFIVRQINLPKPPR